MVNSTDTNSAGTTRGFSMNDDRIGSASSQVVVPNAGGGERLDRFVSLIWECSRAEAARLVREGKVAVNGLVPAARSVRLNPGDKVTLTELPALSQRPLKPDATVGLKLLHEDDHVVVIDKPAHLVVHPGSGHSTGTLVHGLLAQYPEIAQVGSPERPGIVHRLDKGTSGVLMVARTTLAYTALTDALRQRAVERRYIALVEGLPGNDSGVIDAPVGRSQRHPTKMAVVAAGQAARTRYEVVARLRAAAQTSAAKTPQQNPQKLPDAAHLQLQLETGRTHQIRVHLAAIGHPLLGDELYGGPPTAALTRPALHAQTLGFAHPTTGQMLQFSTPIPQDIASLLAQLSA